jgi:protein-disulfide isomerase
VRNGALALVAVAGVALGAGGMMAWDARGPVPNAPAIERVVHDYLMAHPEVIPAAMQRLQERESAKAVAGIGPEVLKPFAGAWAGNPRGDVTVVEYYDYNCGYCRASLPVIQQFLASEPKVRIVYRELPVLSEASGVAAKLAEAAALKGRYKPFHDALYAGGPLTEASMDAAARTAGLDPAQLKAAAQAPEIAHAIEANLQLSHQLGMAGTPSWVIGDRVLSGAQSLDSLRKAVADARGG